MCCGRTVDFNPNYKLWFSVPLGVCFNNYRCKYNKISSIIQPLLLGYINGCYKILITMLRKALYGKIFKRKCMHNFFIEGFKYEKNIKIFDEKSLTFLYFVLFVR